MKIHRVVQMLGATTSTGKLADDMYDLGHKDYYSEAEGRDIPISHMDFQHLVRAFVKQNEEVMKLRNSLQQQKQRADLRSYEAYKYKKLAEDNFISSVDESETSDDWKKKYEELRKTYAVLLEDYNTDTGRGIWKERYEKEVDNAEYWKAQYRIANDMLQPNKGCGYVFSEIPNDTDGQEFVDNMKQYFNKKTYKMRVRGQHIKPELKGTGATYFGQNLNESTHMRVYIDNKN